VVSFEVVIAFDTADEAAAFAADTTAIQAVTDAYAADQGIPSSWVTADVTVLNSEGGGGRRLTAATSVSMAVSVTIPADAAGGVNTVVAQVESGTNNYDAAAFGTLITNALANANLADAYPTLVVESITDAIVSSLITPAPPPAPPADAGDGESEGSAGVAVLVVIIVVFVLLIPTILGSIYYRRRRSKSGEDLSVTEVFFGGGSRKKESVPLTTSGGGSSAPPAGASAEAGWTDHDV